MLKEFREPVIRLLFALALLAGPGFLSAEDEGDQALFKELGRQDCTVVPLWPQGVGPGETKPELGEGFRYAPDGMLLFRPVVKAEMIVMPPPKGTRSTGVAVLFCPGGG